MPKHSKKPLLEQLYDGELFPPEGLVSRNPDYRRASGQADREFQFLLSRLTSEDKQHLDALVDFTGEMDSYTAFANFAYGFRYGALLMLEILLGETA